MELPLLVQPLFRDYFANASTSGLELAADINLTATLRLQASYSALDTRTRRYPDPAADAAAAAMEGAAPKHWASLHALWTPGGGHEFDLMLRRVGEVSCSFSKTGTYPLNARSALNNLSRPEFSWLGVLDRKNLVTRDGIHVALNIAG